MSPVHGKVSVLVVDQYDLSRFFKSVGASRVRDMADSSGLGGQQAKTYESGLADGTFPLSGMFSGGVGEIDERLAAALGGDAANVVSYLIQGDVIGGRAKIVQALHSAYELTAPIGDLVGVTATIQSAANDIDGGVALHGRVSEGADGPAAYVDDEGAQSLNGGVGHLHVIANTAGAGSVVKVQHSTDHVTWVDLVTFTAVGAATKTSERIEVAAGTTVRRYLRATWTRGGGAGAITPVVAFARR